MGINEAQGSEVDISFRENVNSATMSTEPVFTQQPKKNTNWLKIIFAGAVLGLVFWLGIIVEKSMTSKNEKDKTEKSVTVVENEEKKAVTTQTPIDLDFIISQISTTIQTQPNLLSQKNNLDSGFLWISDDGYAIRSEGAKSIIIKTEIAECENYDGTFKQYAQQIGKIVDQQLLANGFQKNISNSSQDINDDSFYDYIQAYEGNGYKVTYMANPDCSGSSSSNDLAWISYITDKEYEQSYIQQMPFVRDLATGKKNFYSVVRLDGDFAMLTVGGRRAGGGMVIVKKVNNVWTEVTGGQDVPMCSVVDEAGVPSSILNSCLDDTTYEDVNR